MVFVVINVFCKSSSNPKEEFFVLYLFSLSSLLGKKKVLFPRDLTDSFEYAFITSISSFNRSFFCNHRQRRSVPPKERERERERQRVEKRESRLISVVSSGISFRKRLQTTNFLIIIVGKQIASKKKKNTERNARARYDLILASLSRERIHHLARIKKSPQHSTITLTFFFFSSSCIFTKKF